MIRTLAPLMVLALAAAISSPAQADPAAVVNRIRREGCGGSAAEALPLARSGMLDRVAEELSRRNEIAQGIKTVGYPAATATSLHARGPGGDAALEQLLSARYCAEIGNAGFTEIGSFERGDEVWIVLAGRLPAPSLQDAADVAARVLALVNEARGSARDCGARRMEAARPVALSTALSNVAALHAQDMAQRSTMGHRGSDGSMAPDRVTRGGYSWRAVAENVAAGQPDADAVVAGWLGSPGHCANIMGPQFTEMGVAFALAPRGNPPVYWAQLLATPQ